MSETFKSLVVIVNFHCSMVLPYCIKAKRCMSIMLWVTGRVWTNVCQRSEAVEHAVLRQLLLIDRFLLDKSQTRTLR